MIHANPCLLIWKGNFMYLLRVNLPNEKDITHTLSPPPSWTTMCQQKRNTQHNTHYLSPPFSCETMCQQKRNKFLFRFKTSVESTQKPKPPTEAHNTQHPPSHIFHRALRKREWIDGPTKAHLYSSTVHLILFFTRQDPIVHLTLLILLFADLPSPSCKLK